MKLIAIVGRKRSGKDTSADFILNHVNGTKYMLAGPIKEALCKAYNMLALESKSGVELSFDDFNGFGVDREAPIVISNADATALFREALTWLKINKKLCAGPDVNIMVNREPWSIRRMMQTLGTDIVVDTYDEQFWSRCMMEEYFNSLKKGDEVFIVTDVRHPHEIAVMRSLGAQIIFVEKDDLNTSTDNHRSELGLTPIEGEQVIHNDGSLAELEQKVLKLIGVVK